MKNYNLVSVYLIDCKGYSNDDLKGLSYVELLDLVTDGDEMARYCNVDLNSLL